MDVRKQDGSMNRTITMVIMNALFGFFLKIALAYIHIYDIAIVIKNIGYIKGQQFISFLNFCSLNWACRLIEKTFFFFYLISFATPLLFYYQFDKLFKVAFDTLLRKTDNNNNNNQATSEKSAAKSLNFVKIK